MVFEVKQRDYDKMLLEISRNGESKENFVRMSQVLLRMYNEDKELYCLTITMTREKDSQIHVLYQYDSGSSVACGTNLENAKKSVHKYNEFAGQMFRSRNIHSLNITGLPCRFVLNNMYYQKKITSITFDEYTSHRFTLPKEYICGLIKDSDYLEVPENFESLKNS